MTEKLHPDLSKELLTESQVDQKPLIPSAPLLYNDISNQVLKNLSKARIKEIDLWQKMIKKDLTHYQKILKRWKKFENGLKATSIIILAGTGIATAITGIGVLLSPLFRTIITTVGVGETVLSQTLVVGLCGKQKEKYNKKIGIIKEYVDKAYFLFQKISQDEIITLEEYKRTKAENKNRILK